jgi:hypothetical protein
MTRWYCRFRLAQSSNILFLNPFTWIINATLCLVYFLTVCNRIFLIAFLHLIRTLKREIEHKIKKVKIKISLSLVKPCYFTLLMLLRH